MADGTDRDLAQSVAADRDTGRAERTAGDDARPDATTWHRIRVGLAVVYFLVLAWIVYATGVPTSRVSLACVVVVGLAINSLGKGWRRLGRVIVDWLPFTLVLIVYDRTRGVAESLGMPLHEADIADAESWLFAGHVPSVALQGNLYRPPHVYPYDVVATLVYTSHFLATPILAAVLWLRNRALWVRYISRVILLSVAGLLTYVLFPEAPPWMASQDGLIGPVSRLSARGWIALHANNLETLLENAQQDGSNPVAAMPSLHVAMATLVAVFIGCQLRSRWRWLLVLYPLAMGLTLVYTGEHYVLDLLAGFAYALGAHYAMRWWEARRRAARALAAHAAADGDEDHAVSRSHLN